jgi:hypothetical protein
MKKNILFALLLAAGTQIFAKEITVTVANVTNKELIIEFAQKGCPKKPHTIKANGYDPVKLPCSLEGIIIKGIPTEIWMTVASDQDISLLLELDKTAHNVIASYFPASQGQEFDTNMRRAGRNLDKITRMLNIENDPKTLKIIAEKESRLTAGYDKAKAVAEYLRTHQFSSASRKITYLNQELSGEYQMWRNCFSLWYELGEIHKKIEDTYRASKNNLKGPIYQEERKKLTDSLEYPQ